MKRYRVLGSSWAFPYIVMRFLCLIAIFAVLSPEPSQAQSATTVGAPAFKVGDAWQFRNYQIDSGRANRTWVDTVTQVIGATIYVETKRLDRGEPISKSEWKLGEGFYNFPMSAGKRWRDKILRNGKEVGEGDYVVGQLEEVSTLAGKFQALKIECTFRIPEGRYRQIIWYAPNVRHFVKLVYVNEQGIATQATELTQYKLQ